MRVNRTVYARKSGYDDTAYYWEYQDQVIFSSGSDQSSIEFKLMIPKENFGIPSWANSSSSKPSSERVGFKKFVFEPTGPYALKFEFITDREPNTSKVLNANFSGWNWHSWPWVYNHSIQNWLYYHKGASGYAVWNNSDRSWYGWNAGTESWNKLSQ
jgi:hypothetical protein